MKLERREGNETGKINLNKGFVVVVHKSVLTRILTTNVTQSVIFGKSMLNSAHNE